ncbi:MAG: 3-phosphoshikimate 1-carboxyvinyltransferase, partial [Gammaproteobacteria bacterium]|nr:3-phosphoshikimate 1-carboxyvinyltransferase [Gammaproteobacteria bacterium]
VRGVGRMGLTAPRSMLDMGNSGTAMRLLTGLLAGQGFASRLTGDDSLLSRPMERVARPLREMGARLTTSAAGTPPVEIAAVSSLHAIDYVLPIPSAQVKSAILLAGIYAEGTTCVSQPEPSRDHTERMLRAMGYPCEIAGAEVCIRGGGELTATDIEVPGDLSAAAFFIAGACTSPGSAITLEHVGVNPTRVGVITLLRQMGADIRLYRERDVGGEPVADIDVHYAPLHGIDVPKAQVPLAIDEIPILCVAAACAQGTTRVSGAAELRHKESDRIAVMVAGLRGLGIDVEEFEDGLSVVGGQLSGGGVNSGGDHRVAMAMAIAGLNAAGPVTITDCDNVTTSFPDFPSLARSLGLSLHTRQNGSIAG